MRHGQDKIADSVSSAIKRGSKLMIHAPTGMGKTAAVLYGALNETYGRGIKVVFLTAKHTHQNIVYDTLHRMNSSSAEIKFAGINGKRSMCLFENNVEPAVFTEFCKAVREQGMCNFYKNTFSKNREMKPAVIDALNEGVGDPLSVMAVSEKYELCPYEVSLLNAKKANVIIANYSHIFDPDIASSFISKAGIDPKKSVLIVDEAHNLPSKISEMNSFSISLRTLERSFSEAVASGYSDLARKVDSIISEMRQVSNEKTVDFTEVFDEKDLEAVESVIEQNEKGYNVPASFTLKKLISILSKADDSYIQYISSDKEHKKMNVFALDPSVYAKQTADSFGSAVFISGTFQPIDMFANLLGIRDAEKLVLGEKELMKNRLMINEIDVTSKFTVRSANYRLTAERIDELLEDFRHNMIVFFPSYNYMEEVHRLLRNKSNVIKEKPNLSREEKSSLLSELSLPGKSMFAVIGGNFSESIGIRNNIIRLVAIVGIPFEPPSVRLAATQDYYEKKSMNGFEYAQVLPSMIKTLQAAGRAIRSSRDKAVILLMDSRYSNTMIRKYLPEGVIEANGSPMKVISEKGFL